MQGVQFEENEGEFTSRQILGAPMRPKMANLLTRIGVAKTEKQASYILMGVTITCFSISAILFIRLML